MRSRFAFRTFALAVMFGVAVNQLVALAAIGDVLIDYVVGQPNGTIGTPNTGGVSASSAEYPFATAFDRAGNLYVADTSNRRVLGYRSPFTTDLVADLVIGQPDFNSKTINNGGVSASSLGGPSGLTVTPDGDLWVVDAYNHRVLQYDQPFATDMVADFVIGQPNFTTRDAPDDRCDAGTLYNPFDVEVDPAGNVWISDEGNGRVLEYDRPIETLNRLADRVIGQPTFTDRNGEDEYPDTDAKSFYHPEGIALDSKGNLWIADQYGNRVLEFDDPLRFDAVADRVRGQPNFSSRDTNYTGSIDEAGLSGPFSVAVDANDNVYVSDSVNNRVLLYRSPIATGDRLADRVFGQPDFNSDIPNNGGLSTQTMYTPLGLSTDPKGNVAVADTSNNRVLLIASPVPIVTSVQVKIARATGKPKLIVRGSGIVNGTTVVEVDGAPLSRTKFKDVTTAGTAGRLIASDDDFEARVPRGVRVQVTLYDPQTGSRSAPIPFTR